MSGKRNERVGEMFILLCVMFGALFPVFAPKSVLIIPPILFSGITQLIAGVILLLYIVIRREGFLRTRAGFWWTVGNALINSFIAHTLVFVAAQTSDAITLTLLLQMEVVFAFMFFGILFGDRIDRYRLIGGLIVFFGTIFILFRGSFTPRMSDVLVLIATFLYPLGNYCSKKIAHIERPSAQLCVRGLISGSLLIVVGVAFERFTVPVYSISSFVAVMASQWWLLLIQGVLYFGVSKVMWLEGLRRLDVSKATVFGTVTPAFGLIYAAIFLHQFPTVPQLFGFGFVFVGLLIASLSRSKQVVAAVIPE